MAEHQFIGIYKHSTPLRCPCFQPQAEKGIAGDHNDDGGERGTQRRQRGAAETCPPFLLADAQPSGFPPGGPKEESRLDQGHQNHDGRDQPDIGPIDELLKFLIIRGSSPPVRNQFFLA